MIILSLAIAVLTIVASWKIYNKAGEPGWASIVPFYNMYVLFKITWGNGWLFLLTLIPLVNFIIGIITLVKLAKVFGKGGGFAVGLIFLNGIFLMILGFGDAVYVGMQGQNAVQQPYYGAPQQPYAQPYAQPQQPYAQPQQPYAQPQQAYAQPQQAYAQPQQAYAQPQQEQPADSVCCPNCGNVVDGNAQFCNKCGGKLR